MEVLLTCMLPLLLATRSGTFDVGVSRDPLGLHRAFYLLDFHLYAFLKDDKIYRKINIEQIDKISYK